MIKKNTWTIILLIFSIIGNGQSGVPGVKIVPPSSPDLAALVKYEYPVDYAYGVPKIDLPLYTIISRKLQVPISLSYHASGIKVDEIASRVGLGWNLFVGGAINRSLRGSKEDENGFLSYPSNIIKPLNQVTSDCNNTANPTQCINDYYASYWQNYDLEADLYSYNANGISGKFTYNSNKSPVHIPTTSKLVERLIDNNFVITTENGDQYYFLDKESLNGNNGSSFSYVKSWLLSKIISADKTDTVTFIYTTDPNTYYEYNQYQYIKGGTEHQQNANSMPNSCQCIISTVTPVPTIHTQNGYTAYNDEKILSKIIFAGGEVKFINNQDRLDKRKYRTIGVEVYNIYNQLIDKITFSQTYFESNTSNPLTKYRLRLDAVGFGINNPTKDYLFEYDPIALPPYFEDNYSSSVNDLYRGQDLWGYFNGITNNMHLIPQVPAGATAANRSTSEIYKKASILKKIILPTGGYTSFEFESNKGIINSVETLVGGLRIKELLTSTGGSGTTIKKTFKYGNDENGLGDLMTFAPQDLYSRVVTSYIGGVCGTNTPSKVTYYYSTPIFNLAEVNGSPVIYPTVAEYFGDNGANIGKVVRTYSNIPDNGYGSMFEKYNNIFFYDNSWKRGHLLIESTFKRNTDGSYVLAKETQNTYTDFNAIASDYGKEIVYISNATLAADCSRGYYYSSFQSMPKIAYSGYKLLTQSKQTNYEANGIVVSSKDFQYEGIPNHSNITYIKESNSKGETVFSTLKYPHDYPTLPPYNIMISRNMLTPVIEQAQFKDIVSNASFVRSSKTNYDYWGGNNWTSTASNFIVPRIVETKTLTNPSEVRLRYHSYDEKGNIGTVSNEGDVKKSYLWGYNKTYPVAEATNASSDRIAYTSFEDNEMGGWSMNSGGTIINSNIVTGRKTYSGGVYKTVPQGDYIVSIWAAANCSVNGIVSGTALRLSKRDGWWRHFQWKLTNVTSIQVWADNMDEVRLYPVGGQMTTYTYDPLIGMTSQCDVNNNITYYRYDAFGRLSYVLDRDYNVLKRFCYNYAGQQENCTINLTPLWTSTSNYRCVKDGNNNNTGAQEREEKDLNPTSQTYNQLRWVSNGTNTSSCPLPNQVTVNGYNYVSYNFTVRFTNLSTSVQYEMSLSSYNNNTIGIPAGNYDVMFYPGGGSPPYATFTVNGYSQYNYGGANFYNIPIGGSAYVQISN